MKALIPITFLLLSFLTSVGQDLDITPKVMIRSDSEYKIIGKINETIMMVVEDNGFYKIHAFNEDMTNKWERSLKMERKTVKVNGFISRKNDFSVFYSYRYKGKNYIKQRRLDEKLNIVDSTTLKIFSKRSLSPTVHFETSSNNKKALMYSVENSNEFELTVVDNDSMRIELEVKFKAEDFSYQQDFLQTVVDNDGGVYFIFEKDNRKSKIEDNIFKVFYFNPGSDDIRFFNISMANHLWYDVYFDFDNMSKKLVVGGFYSDETILEAQGIFFMAVSPNESDQITSNFEAFSKEYLGLLLGKKLRKNIGFNEVSVQQIVPRHDGGILMIAERYKEESRDNRMASDPYQQKRRDYSRAEQIDYFYNEILLYSFHPDGELHWTEILHKKQYSQDDDGVFSSFFLFLNKSQIRFLYNDTVKRSDTVYEYIVSGNGEAERNSLFNTKADNLMLRMPDAVQISSNTIIVPSERRSSVKLVKMTF